MFAILGIAILYHKVSVINSSIIKCDYRHGSFNRPFRGCILRTYKKMWCLPSSVDHFRKAMACSHLVVCFVCLAYLVAHPTNPL